MSIRWWAQQGSNLRPADYDKSGELPNFGGKAKKVKVFSAAVRGSITETDPIPNLLSGDITGTVH